MYHYDKVVAEMAEKSFLKSQICLSLDNVVIAKTTIHRFKLKTIAIICFLVRHRCLTLVQRNMSARNSGKMATLKRMRTHHQLHVIGTNTDYSHKPWITCTSLSCLSFDYVYHLNIFPHWALCILTVKLKVKWYKCRAQKSITQTQGGHLIIPSFTHWSAIFRKVFVNRVLDLPLWKVD